MLGASVTAPLPLSQWLLGVPSVCHPRATWQGGLPDATGPGGHAYGGCAGRLRGGVSRTEEREDHARPQGRERKAGGSFRAPSWAHGFVVAATTAPGSGAHGPREARPMGWKQDPGLRKSRVAVLLRCTQTRDLGPVLCPPRPSASPGPAQGLPGPGRRQWPVAVFADLTLFPPVRNSARAALLLGVRSHRQVCLPSEAITLPCPPPQGAAQPAQQLTVHRLGPPTGTLGPRAPARAV